jgi:hypothetical protein
MGCSITCTAYKKLHDGTFKEVPTSTFQYKNYHNTAFLADVRNETGIVPIPFSGAERPSVREGNTDDYTGWPYDYGPEARTWFTLKELLEFNYSQPCRREGTETYREFLGEEFFDELRELHTSGVTHVMFEMYS